MLKDYTTVVEMERWLSQHGVATATWASRGRGSTEELFDDIMLGKVELKLIPQRPMSIEPESIERHVQSVEVCPPRHVMTAHRRLLTISDPPLQVRMLQGSSAERPSQCDDVEGHGHLIETMHLYQNGRQRPHRAPLKSVIRGGEDTLQCAQRGMTEQIGDVVPINVVKVDMRSLSKPQQTRGVSSTYPGLKEVETS